MRKPLTIIAARSEQLFEIFISEKSNPRVKIGDRTEPGKMDPGKIPCNLNSTLRMTHTLLNEPNKAKFTCFVIKRLF